MAGREWEPVREQRRHARAWCRQRCWCEGENITIYAQIGNLSEGGLFLRTSAPLTPGARVRVRLAVDPGEVELPARVAWRRDRQEPSDTDPGMGLRFEQPGAQAFAVLRSHVSRLLRGEA
jgi:uncharacterized protein (TIGR02266 family)